MPAAAAAGETLIELKLAALPKRQLHALWFLPPLIMALIPILHTLFMPHDEAFLWMLLAYGMDFLITLLFAALYRLINRQRADVVDENSALTAAAHTRAALSMGGAHGSPSPGSMACSAWVYGF